MPSRGGGRNLQKPLEFLWWTRVPVGLFVLIYFAGLCAPSRSLWLLLLCLLSLWTLDSTPTDVSTFPAPVALKFLSCPVAQIGC